MAIVRESNRLAAPARARVAGLVVSLAVALLLATAISTAAWGGEDREAVPEREGVAVRDERHAVPDRGSTADRDGNAAVTRETGVTAAASVEADAETEADRDGNAAVTRETGVIAAASVEADAETEATSAGTVAKTDDATTTAGVATMEDEAGSGGSTGPATVLTDEGRAVAVGYLLDTPRSPEVTDRALAVSEKLRRRYGIDTGHPVIDREDAARRAQAELLDRLEFEDREVREMAGKLGYSLDPDSCANYCDNVRELAEIELRRLALERFADGKPFPGRLRETAPEAQTGEETEEGESPPETAMEEDAPEPGIFSGSTTEEDPEN